MRNALARFDRVAWEDDAARDRARRRLLHAAKRFGIMPVGFINRQLGSSRTRGPALPTGIVTFLLTDIEGSTALLRQLGDDYAALLRDVRACTRTAVAGAGGHPVDSHGDEFFAVFERSGRRGAEPRSNCSPRCASGPGRATSRCSSGRASTAAGPRSPTPAT